MRRPAACPLQPPGHRPILTTCSTCVTTRCPARATSASARDEWHARAQLSQTANGEYDARDRLVAIQITELDETAAEFLRTADEETLLRVIREQAGRRKAGSQPPPGVVREPRRGR